MNAVTITKILKKLDTSLNEGETIIVPDPLHRKWSKKDIPVNQQQ